MAARMVCMACESVTTARTQVRGSILLEVVLWCMGLVPGLIYSIWRLTTKAKVCRQCGGGPLVPLDSPAGRRVVAQSAGSSG